MPILCALMPPSARAVRGTESLLEGWAGAADGRAVTVPEVAYRVQLR